MYIETFLEVGESRISEKTCNFYITSRHKMPTPPYNNAPVDCAIASNTGELKGRSVLVTGGEQDRFVTTC